MTCPQIRKSWSPIDFYFLFFPTDLNALSLAIRASRYSCKSFKKFNVLCLFSTKHTFCERLVNTAEHLLAMELRIPPRRCLREEKKIKNAIGLRFSVWLRTHRIRLSHTYMHISLNLYGILRGVLILSALEAQTHLKAWDVQNRENVIFNQEQLSFAVNYHSKSKKGQVRHNLHISAKFRKTNNLSKQRNKKHRFQKFKQACILSNLVSYIIHCRRQ